MKSTHQLPSIVRRHLSHDGKSRVGRSLPLVSQYYQTPVMHGGCGSPSKFRRPAFFQLSSDYFANEAPRGFAVEAVIFSALIFTAVLPIVNGVQAMVALAHNISLF